MRIVAMLVLMFLSSCLGTGCTVAVTPADKLFGSAAQQPKLKVNNHGIRFVRIHPHPTRYIQQKTKKSPYPVPANG